MTRRVAGLILLLLLIAGPGCVVPVRTPERHLLPEGYVGWARAYYGVAGAAPLSLEEGYHLLRYPESGELETSSPRPMGMANDEYYYVRGDTRRPLPTSAPGGSGMIWGKHEGSTTLRREGDKVQRSGAHCEFFVGTYEQFQQASDTLGP